MKWQQFKPIGDRLVIKEDKQQTHTAGGIVLTERLPMAAEVGFYTGTVLKVGNSVEETLGMSDLIGKKICHRQYLSTVVTFEDKEDGQTVFLLHAKDVEGFVGAGVTVHVL